MKLRDFISGDSQHQKTGGYYEHTYWFFHLSGGQGRNICPSKSITGKSAPTASSVRWNPWASQFNYLLPRKLNISELPQLRLC